LNQNHNSEIIMNTVYTKTKIKVKITLKN